MCQAASTKGPYTHSKKQGTKPLSKLSFLQRTLERGGKFQCVLNDHVCAAHEGKHRSLSLAILESLFQLGPHSLLLFCLFVLFF